MDKATLRLAFQNGMLAMAAKAMADTNIATMDEAFEEWYKQISPLLALTEGSRQNTQLPGSDNSSLEFLEWFYGNADFGPASEDVFSLMKEQYERETGKKVPEGY